VWGSSANDVWLVGTSAAQRWNGTAFSSVLTGTTQTLRAVWGRVLFRGASRTSVRGVWPGLLFSGGRQRLYSLRRRRV
jgi:hypothetical protein